MFYVIIRYIGIVLFKVLFRLQVYGRKNIPLKGGFILASNHTSYLDPPVLGAACPRVLFYLAKEELFKNPAFAWLITKLNAIPVHSQFSVQKSLRRVIRELRAGRPVTIFPEGRRTINGKLIEPLRGVGLLAVKAGVFIIPAFIKGSNMAMPVHSKFIYPKKIKVYFGRPIFPEKVELQSNKEDFYQALATKTMQEISRLKNMAA